MPQKKCYIRGILFKPNLIFRGLLFSQNKCNIAKHCPPPRRLLPLLLHLTPSSHDCALKMIPNFHHQNAWIRILSYIGDYAQSESGTGTGTGTTLSYSSSPPALEHPKSKSTQPRFALSGHHRVRCLSGTWPRSPEIAAEFPDSL